MEEKIKLSPAIIILTIILIGTLGYNGYEKFIVKDNNTKKITNEKKPITVGETTYKDYQEKKTNGAGEKYVAYYKFTINGNYGSDVPVQDTYSFANYENTESKINLQYILLNNGKVYHYLTEIVGNKDDSIRVSDTKLKELTGLPGKVKRIKSVNFTTGESYDQILIMEDGSSYDLYMGENNKLELSKDEELSKYKIDNIINYESACENGYIYKVILKDGIILEKTIK